MHTTDEAAAQAAFEEYQRIMMNEMVGVLPIGTMIKRFGFQSNIRGIEDAVWLTNNNYLGFAMEKIWIDKALNEKIWERGIQKPPKKITVKAVKYDDGLVEVSLAEVAKPETTE